MNGQVGLKAAVKVAVFWFGFLMLHFLYDWLPILPVALFSGVSEAVFQHAKIAFYVYLLVSLVETLIFAKKTSNKQRFILPRLLAALIVPWLMILIWYLAPAIYGKPMPSEALEIVYANLAVAALGFCAVTLEGAFSQIEFKRGQVVVILVLLVISILHFTVFTFTMPWADIFTPPVY